MRIVHRFAFDPDDAFGVAMARLGIEFEHKCVAVIHMGEDEALWPEVAKLWDEHPLASHFINNVFSSEEMDAADWFLVSAKGHHGYPQPEDSYLEHTYDLTDYCQRCGIGHAQKEPFRIRGEPKAPRSQFLQLNWVFDELFVRTTAREVLTEAGITGIDFIPPILHKKDRSSEQVAQMKIAHVLPAGLEATDLQTVTCKANNEEDYGNESFWTEHDNPPYCGRVKYHEAHRGPFQFPDDTFEGAPDVVKSHEWFGSSSSAYRVILVSQSFRKLVSREGWRGLHFEPIELCPVDGP